MKILFLTPQLPYPPISGGIIKTYKLIKYLSENHSVGLCHFLKEDDSDYIDLFKNEVKLKEHYYEKLDIKRTTKNLIRSYMENKPLNLYRNFSKTFENKIRNMIVDYDLVFIDHYVMYQYVKKTNIKKILHEHNTEYNLWKTTAFSEKNIFKKAIIYLESQRIMKFEKSICIDADIILASPNDIINLKLFTDSNKFIKTYHLGDENLLQMPNIDFPSKSRILYVGTLSWEPNNKGLIWFIDTIWVDLKNSYPDIELDIIGKNPSEVLEKLILQKDGINLLGFVDDLEKYYSSTKIFISPLLSGSGMKVKVINAMYRGIPTITTKSGVEGIDIVNGKHIVVAKDKSEWLNAFSLLFNKEKWESIRDSSRELMRSKYTWDSVYKNIDKALLNE